jgi:hypothetical protein
MLFWMRELLGWLLILVALFCFYVAIGIVMADGPLLIEASYHLFVGFVVFRGGLTILKLSMAGRICLDAQKEALALTMQPMHRPDRLSVDTKRELPAPQGRRKTASVR